MTQEPVEVARNGWGVVLHHDRLRALELRWLPSTNEMSDDGFKETLELLAAQGDRAKPAYMIIDATEFHHKPGDDALQWRDRELIPRYNSAGVKKFAFLNPHATHHATVESGGTPQPEGSAEFPTGWFTTRQRLYQWLMED